MTPDASYGARHRRLGAASAEMLELAFAYVLTGEARYAARARDLAASICADDTPWVDPRHAEIYPELNADLRFASVCIDLSVALGWLADALPGEDAERILDVLAARGEVIYDDTLRGAWWGDALNSNWTSHLMHGLGAAALALLPSRPEIAQPWVEPGHGPYAAYAGPGCGRRGWHRGHRLFHGLLCQHPPLWHRAAQRHGAEPV